MNIIEFKNVSKSFFTQKLYSDINLEINSRDKIALLGNNGTGKSTFIKLIKDDELPDEGEVLINEEARIACFDQFGSIDQTMKVRDLLNLPFQHIIDAQAELEEISTLFSEDDDENAKLLQKYSELSDRFESMGGYSYIHVQSEFIDVFELGDKLEKKFSELSGGERQYIRLAVVLFSDSDFIILDEPLSFFDKKRTAWLSEYIADSRKAFLVVSHNVDFIRSFANRVFDVDNFSVTAYNSNYQTYVRDKKALIARAKKLNIAAELVIEKTNRASDRKQILLEKCENKHAQAVILRRMERELEKLEKSKIEFSPEYRYKYTEAPKEAFFSSGEIDSEIVILRDVSKEFPDKVLYKNLNLTVSKDSKIAIVGENGSGKSTLLNLLTGKEEVSSGEIFVNSRAKISFVNQETVFPNEKISIIDYLKDKTGLSEDFIEIAVDTLYNDEPEFRDKRIFMLSGGEKKRLEIFANTLTEIDLLIVDEPSTYMDEYSRNAIATMLLDFPGAVIIVTHDKALLKKLEFTTYDIRDKRFRIKESAQQQ
ncbi:MAG: ABC-F family ATP-binding cassette domain-containing protein [Fusobacteriaceae bacterium]